MTSELRRSPREPEFLPIRVQIQDTSNTMLAGPFSGRIIDISQHGACLLMSQVMIGATHVFHSTMEDDSRSLQLVIDVPPDMTEFSVSARPVWMDVYRKKEIRAFKMGVDFITSPEGKQMRELKKAMKRQQQERADWWLQNNQS